MKHPIQPLEKDEHGTLRFKENKIVRYLLDKGDVDLNRLAVMDFDNDDREQFHQLIGYSLCGFGEIGSTTDETYNAAEGMHKNPNESELQARYNALNTQLDEIKTGLRVAAAFAFNTHPDDFGE